VHFIDVFVIYRGVFANNDVTGIVDMCIRISMYIVRYWVFGNMDANTDKYTTGIGIRFGIPLIVAFTMLTYAAMGVNSLSTSGITLCVVLSLAGACSLERN
jgi:hypothetical protein